MFYSLFDSWLTGIGYFFGVLSTLASESYHDVLVYWGKFLWTSDTVTVFFTCTNLWTGKPFYLTTFQPNSTLVEIFANIQGLVNQIITQFFGGVGLLLGVNDLPFVLGLAIVVLVFLFVFRMIKWMGNLFNPLKGA